MTQTPSHTPRRRGRPTKSGAPLLSTEKIISVALDMTRAEVGEPLTFRTLGARLGVDPSALYRYIPSKDGLLLMVADGIIQEALENFTESGNWRKDVFDVLSRVHRAYLSHPQVALSAVTRVTRLPAEMEFTELMLRVLETSGIPPSSAVTAYRSLEDTMLAWTGFRANVLLMNDAEAEMQDWEQVYRNADVARFPRVVAQAIPMTAVSLQEGFETALNLLLDGITFQISRRYSSESNSDGTS